MHEAEAVRVTQARKIRLAEQGGAPGDPGGHPHSKPSPEVTQSSPLAGVAGGVGVLARASHEMMSICCNVLRASHARHCAEGPTSGGGLVRFAST